MRRNEKKTVTTIEITWETSSRVIVSRGNEAMRYEDHAEENNPATKGSRLLNAAKKFLRGEDDEAQTVKEA